MLYNVAYFVGMLIMQHTNGRRPLSMVEKRTTCPLYTAQFSASTARRDNLLSGLSAVQNQTHPAAKLQPSLQLSALQWKDYCRLLMSPQTGRIHILRAS
jgi:hypothetical protein